MDPTFRVLTMSCILPPKPISIYSVVHSTVQSIFTQGFHELLTISIYACGGCTNSFCADCHIAGLLLCPPLSCRRGSSGRVGGTSAPLLGTGERERLLCCTLWQRTLGKRGPFWSNYHRLFAKMHGYL